MVAIPGVPRPPLRAPLSASWLGLRVVTDYVFIEALFLHEEKYVQPFVLPKHSSVVYLRERRSNSRLLWNLPPDF